MSLDASYVVRVRAAGLVPLVATVIGRTVRVVAVNVRVAELLRVQVLEHSRAGGGAVGRLVRPVAAVLLSVAVLGLAHALVIVALELAILRALALAGRAERRTHTHLRLQLLAELLRLVGAVGAVGEQVTHLGLEEAAAEGAAVRLARRRLVQGRVRSLDDVDDPCKCRKGN